ncbi:TPA: glycosyl transferase [Enterobacter cloacae]|nr:glycosyl transferase [Enterobacter cloacae]
MAKFKKDFGFSPDLLHPLTFNEKILYRMINPVRTEFITHLADKVKAREYVERIHPEILPVVYGVFNDVNDIDISFFPEKFVLKCNHDSGSVVICTNKEDFDFAKAKNKLSLHLKMNAYYKTREWQYKEIKPVVICEEYIDRTCMTHFSFTPDVYRFHCFDSEVIFVEVDYSDNENNQYTNIYNNRWDIQNVRLNGRAITPVEIVKPDRFLEALSVAERLSKEIDYCRVDLYITSSKIYFSEFTFSPKNGREIFEPAEWDVIFGGHWKLRLNDYVDDISVADAVKGDKGV